MSNSLALKVIEQARAKINLTLHVTGRRADGYHLLDSLVVFADYGDELILSPATITSPSQATGTTSSLDISGPFGKGLKAENNNLILRAHRVLSQAINRLIPATHFQLIKNLPISSGIGGGSADAGAALRGLIWLWQLDVDASAVKKCALQLGADVPVCLTSKTGRMRSIGEQLELIGNFPSFSIVLVNAGAKISTPSIFSDLNLKMGRPAFSKLEPFDTLHTQDQWIDWLTASRNDLQNAAMKQSTTIKQTLEAINQTSGVLFSQMSGSGATCFGLFSNQDTAQLACAQIKQDHPDWWAIAAQIY